MTEETNNEIFDLLYCGDYEDKIREMVLQDYPDAKLEDATDTIHHGRFSVAMEIEEDDWLLWVMRKGIHNLSFYWQAVSMDNPERMKPLVRKVLEEQKEEDNVQDNTD